MTDVTKKNKKKPILPNHRALPPTTVEALKHWFFLVTSAIFAWQDTNAADVTKKTKKPIPEEQK